MKYLTSLLIFTLFSCASHSGDTNAFRVAVLRGPSALAFADWMGDEVPVIGKDTCRIKWVDTPEQMQALLVKHEADMAVLPMISAANLYNKGIDYSLLGCPLWGTLYLVSKGDIHPPVYLFGRGTTPDILARHALDSLRQEDFNYTFASVGEVLQALLLGKAETAVLSEPFLSAALRRDSSLQIAANLNRPHGALPGFPQTAIVCNSAALAYRTALDSLLRQSCIFANTHPEEAIRRLEEAGVFAPGMLTPESVHRCGIHYRTAQEAATVISSFLELVWQTEPQAIGGKLPDSTFIVPRP